MNGGGMTKKGFVAVEAAIITTIIVILGLIAWGQSGRSAIYVNGKEVYRGFNFCASVESAGASTKVTVVCALPSRVYVSDDVRVAPL